MLLKTNFILHMKINKFPKLEGLNGYKVSRNFLGQSSMASMKKLSMKQKKINFISTT